MAKAKEKKKKWIKIVAPSEFNNKVLGETIKRDKLIGKTLKVSVFNITGDFKKQTTNLSFIINDVKDDQANTELDSYHSSTSHLKRLVRKSKDKIDDSFVAETSDKIKIKIKPIMLTRLKTSNSVLTALRKRSREVLISHVKEIRFVDLIKEVVFNKIQGRVRSELKRIYPLSLFEIRTIEKV